MDERSEDTVLTEWQLKRAAQYVCRWRGWHPDDAIAAENEIRSQLYNSVAVRAIAMAARMKDPNP